MAFKSCNSRPRKMFYFFWWLIWWQNLRRDIWRIDDWKGIQRDGIVIYSNLRRKRWISWWMYTKEIKIITITVFLGQESGNFDNRRQSISSIMLLNKSLEKKLWKLFDEIRKKNSNAWERSTRAKEEFKENIVLRLIKIWTNCEKLSYDLNCDFAF